MDTIITFCQDLRKPGARLGESEGETKFSRVLLTCQKLVLTGDNCCLLYIRIIEFGTNHWTTKPTTNILFSERQYDGESKFVKEKMIA